MIKINYKASTGQIVKPTALLNCSCGQFSFHMVNIFMGYQIS